MVCIKKEKDRERYATSPAEAILREYPELPELAAAFAIVAALVTASSPAIAASLVTDITLTAVTVTLVTTSFSFSVTASSAELCSSASFAVRRTSFQHTCRLLYIT